MNNYRGFQKQIITFPFQSSFPSGCTENKIDQLSLNDNENWKQENVKKTSQTKNLWLRFNILVEKMVLKITQNAIKNCE